MVLEDTGKWEHSEPEPPLLGINLRGSECLHVSEQNEDKWQGVPHTPPPVDRSMLECEVAPSL